MKTYYYFIFLTWAIVDMATGFFLYFDIPPFNLISVGMIVRIPFLLLTILLSLFYPAKTDRILPFIAFTLLVILGTQSIFYANTGFLIQNLLKISSIIFLIPVFASFRKRGLFSDKMISNILVINTFVIILNLILPLFGIGFGKYGFNESGIAVGSVGFFFSGNELNIAILLLYSSILFFYSEEKFSFSKKVVLFFIVAILTLSKTVLLGFLFITFLYWYINFRGNKLFVLLGFIIISIISYEYLLHLPSVQAYVERNIFFYEKSDHLSEFLLSGRLSRLSAFAEAGFFSNYGNLLMGTSLKGEPNFTFEMDYLDLSFYYGFLGILLISLFWVQYFFLVLRLTTRVDKVFYVNIFLLYNGVAFFAGHSLASQTALPFLLLFLIISIKKENRLVL